MLYALIILAIGLLLITTAPRHHRCNHQFVPSDSLAYIDRRATTYRCERCGLEIRGTA